MSEKRKPTYDLDSVRAWAGTSKFAVTGTVRRTAGELGYGSSEMAGVIRTMERSHFFKSVTSINNSQEWQDVYHVPSEIGLLYVKFRADVVTEFMLLSFKEKDDV